jgi:hypothetical protein
LIRNEYENSAEVSLDNLLGRLVFYPDGGASAGGISSAVLLDSERARLHGRRRIGSSMRDRWERLRGTSLHDGSVRMVHVPNDPGRAARRCDLVGCSRAASGVLAKTTRSGRGGDGRKPQLGENDLLVWRSFNGVLLIRSLPHSPRLRRGRPAHSPATLAGLTVYVVAAPRLHSRTDMRRGPPRRARVGDVQKQETRHVSHTGFSVLATSYSRTTYRRTTIGAAAFHFRVRNGNGWFHRARVTRVRNRTGISLLSQRRKREAESLAILIARAVQ